MPDLRHIEIDHDAGADHAELRTSIRRQQARGIEWTEERKRRAHSAVARMHQGKVISSFTPAEPGRVLK